MSSAHTSSICQLKAVARPAVLAGVTAGRVVVAPAGEAPATMVAGSVVVVGSSCGRRRTQGGESGGGTRVLSDGAMVTNALHMARVSPTCTSAMRTSTGHLAHSHAVAVVRAAVARLAGTLRPAMKRVAAHIDSTYGPRFLRTAPELAGRVS
jgi:hypothetical protein